MIGETGGEQFHELRDDYLRLQKTVVAEHDRASAAESSLAAEKLKVEERDTIIAECATACGALVSPETSIEFKRLLPGEISAKIARTKTESEQWVAALVGALNLASGVLNDLTANGLIVTIPEDHSYGTYFVETGVFDTIRAALATEA